MARPIVAESYGLPSEWWVGAADGVLETPTVAGPTSSLAVLFAQEGSRTQRDPGDKRQHADAAALADGRTDEHDAGPRLQYRMLAETAARAAVLRRRPAYN